MQIQLNTLTPKTKNSWEKLLLTHTNNTVFQSPIMYDFYKKVQNFDPFFFLVHDDTNEECLGVLLAVLIKEGKGIKGYLSSRIVVYGGPIIIEEIENRNEILNLLLKKLVEKTVHRSMFIQFRNFFEWSKSEKQIFSNNGFFFRERLNLLVKTTDKDTALSNLSSSKRRQIRKGLSEGVHITEPQNEEEVHSFYKLLQELYKNKVRKPLPTWSFFKEFYSFSNKGELGIIRLIKFKNIIIGGLLSPITPEKAIYEWYVVGLNKEFKKQYPSILATWAPIEYAINNNLQHFDFMGLGKPKDDYGVRDFKMKFGKNTVNYGRFGRRNNKLLYAIVEIGYNIMRSIGKI
ncbi:MAG: peptidoglycan bridge formation glycyltransferase FemA/FemB family protein [Bacteroidota bacterium]